MVGNIDQGYLNASLNTPNVDFNQSSNNISSSDSSTIHTTTNRNNNTESAQFSTTENFDKEEKLMVSF